MVSGTQILKDIPLNKLKQWMNVELFRDCLKYEKHSRDAEIKIISVKPAVAVGENYISNIYRVKVEFNHDGLKKYFSFIVKSIIPSAEESLKNVKVFEKEVMMYEKLLPGFEKLYQEIGENIQLGPKLYKVLTKPEKVLIFEDLDMRNFMVMNRHDGLDFNHCKLYYEKIAKLHAASVVYREKNGEYCNKTFVPLFHKSVDMIKDYLDGIYPYFLEAIKDNKNLNHLADKVENWRGKYMDEMCRFCESNSNSFNVLCHGDPWLNNFLYCHENDMNPNDILFIDFQLGFYGSPIYDLYYFFASSTQSHVKEHDFDDLIFHYHTTLVSNLKKLNFKGKIPTLRELNTELLQKGFSGAVFALFIMPIVLLEARKDANMDGLLDNSDNSDELKRAMFQSSRYVQNLEALFKFLEKRGLVDL